MTSLILLFEKPKDGTQPFKTFGSPFGTEIPSIGFSLRMSTVYIERNISEPINEVKERLSKMTADRTYVYAAKRSLQRY
jgi:hypothetical protein